MYCLSYEDSIQFIYLKKKKNLLFSKSKYFSVDYKRVVNYKIVINILNSDENTWLPL